MTNGHILTSDDAWTGGHYELLFDVGDGKPAPDRVTEVAAALWAHPCLDGPYPRRDLEPDRQARSELGTGDGYGTATLPDGAVVPCASWTWSSLPDFRPDGEPHPPDLLAFSLPLDPLARVWPQIGGFPFQQGQDTRIWQEPLDNWLAGIAADTYARARFSRAVVDFELDADYDLWRSWTRETVPVERRVGILLTAGDELDYLHRTIWE
jgi:hypothetical protein